MKVLVACDFSGVTRDEFAARGHDAYSCDLIPSERPGQHFQEDVGAVLARERFDLMIAHPPCTHLAVSGARWFGGKRTEQAEAIRFVLRLAASRTPLIAIENPISILSTSWRKPDQIVQPWMFWDGEPGKGERKATCLWLKGLPKLVPTTPDETGRVERVWRMGPSPNRARERSRTPSGLATAMAQQWGSISVGCAGVRG